MSEPEDILLDGAHHATLFVRRIWRRQANARQPEVLHLVDVRPRLELFLRAAFGRALTVGIAEAPALPSLFSRLGRRIPRHLIERRALASTDGERIRLPRTLPAADRGLDRYRLLATGLAARAVRGTPRYLPSVRLVRDLFLIREAAAVDAMLAAQLPGLLPDLRIARAAAAATRPRADVLTLQEAAVEEHLMAVLRTDPLEATASSPDPEASLSWAEAAAASIRARGGAYRGLPAVEPWGLVTTPDRATARNVTPAPPDDFEDPDRKPRVSMMIRRPKVRLAPDDEDDGEMGLWMIQLDDPQEHVEDPMGLQRPTDREAEANPEDLADSLSELPEARLVATPGRPREVLASEEPPPPSTAEATRGGSQTGLVYPEWDYRIGAYHDRGAVVRVATPPLGDPSWAEGVLARRATLLREVRRRFERLRPRRLRLGRQLDGPEVDLAAYVASYADCRAGREGDDRLYVAIRSARRDVAIALLVDVSGSTDSWVTENLRVVDVEKEALLVVCDALEALGDPYTILAFSGEGPEAVSIFPIKLFDEPGGGLVRRRIAALEPDRYTRMGAAVRHATALLMRKAARHRLLLVLSDGKPNDVDRYEGRYGVEDARQAVVEARLQGLHPFCVTVDRRAPAYMPRIFGAGAYAALHHPEHLPSVLVDVLRRMVKA